MSPKRSKCPHLDSIGLQYSLAELSKFKQGSPCSDCSENGLNFWICLYKNCYHVGCSEKHNNHSTEHFETHQNHCIHMNLRSQRMWCYKCEKEVFLMNGNTHAPSLSQPQRRFSSVPSSNNDSSDTNSTTKFTTTERVNMPQHGPVQRAQPNESCGDSSDEEDEQNSRNLNRGGLVGLQNIANTCYMNAALQALSNSPPLTGYFLDCGSIVEATADMAPQNQRKFGLAKNYYKLIKDMWSNSRRTNGYVVPSGILSCIRNVHPMFRGFQQHDTQEFLRCFMDQLHEELKEVTPPPPDILFNNNTNMANNNNIDQNKDDDYSPCSSPSPSQSENEYETCDSGVSEQSSLSDECFVSSFRDNKNFKRSSSPTPNINNNNSNNNNSNHNNNVNNNGNPNSNKVIDKVNSVASMTQQIGGGESNKQKLPHRSIISDVFDGKLLSSVQCLTCDRISTREETFQDLSLPIPGKDHLAVIHHNHYGSGMSSNASGHTQPSGMTCTDAVYQASQEGWFWWFWNWFKSWLWGPAVSLHDCMAAFFSADELKGDNMYSCEKCNKLRNGVKYSRVLALPEMLCVHLKRFRHDLSYSSKISSPVHFPLTGLDMRPYLHKDCKSEISQYDLTAVICHHGTVGSGHYTSFAKHEPTRKWYEYDDQMVTEVTPEVVENCEAYVLFYRKSNPQMHLLRSEALKIARQSPPHSSDIRFFVSQQWLNRFNTFAEPGPIDNWALLCPHGALPPQKAALISRLVCPLPQPVWDFLYDRFGGGPACNHLFECGTCRRAAESLSLRQATESNEFSILHDEFQLQENPSTIYAISMVWFRQWQLFARGITTEEPGPVNNNSIAAPSETLPIKNVRPGSDYAQINTKLWKFFYGIYGGGPEIILKGAPSPPPAPAQPVVIENQPTIRKDQGVDENMIEVGEYNNTHSHDDNTTGKADKPHSKSVHTVSNNTTSDKSNNVYHGTSVKSYTNKGSTQPSEKTKNVSFEFDECVVGATDDSCNTSQTDTVSSSASSKRSRKDSMQSGTSFHNGPATSEIINKKDNKKYRGMKNSGLFGAEGKYSDYTQAAQNDSSSLPGDTKVSSHHYSNSVSDAKQSNIDEIMPLLHQTKICNGGVNSSQPPPSSNYKSKGDTKREKSSSTNGHNLSLNSNRKKFKSKSFRKSMQVTTPHNNNDSDST